MDIRILSFVFALLLLGLTRYNNAPVSSPIAPTEPPRAVAASAAKSQTAEVFRYEPSPSPSPLSVESVLIVAPEIAASPSPAMGPGSSPISAEPVLDLNLAAEELNARDAALFDLKTGEVLFMKGSEEPRPIASISKLMTAVLAKEIFSPDVEFVMAAEDFSDPYFHPDLRQGDILTLDEALHIMLIYSDNAVAAAVARTYGWTDFVKKMNEKARELRMINTAFFDPTGLADNVSTPRDLLRLAQYISKSQPQIFEITRIPAITLITRRGKRFNLRNTDLLAGQMPTLLGGKTGQTDTAGGCLLVVFSNGRRDIMGIVLGSADRFADMEKLVNFSRKF